MATLLKINKPTDDQTECRMVYEVVGGGTTNLITKGLTEFIHQTEYHQQLLHDVIGLLSSGYVRKKNERNRSMRLQV